MLPLLQRAGVPPGWGSNPRFLAGYGAAQAVPGPLFTFAAYLGAVAGARSNGLVGAAITLGGIYLPPFLLVTGVLAFGDRLRPGRAPGRVLRATNAAVVGLLLAAVYHPVWMSAIHGPAGLAFALGAFALLAFWRLVRWIVVWPPSARARSSAPGCSDQAGRLASIARGRCLAAARRAEHAGRCPMEKEEPEERLGHGRPGRCDPGRGRVGGIVTSAIGNGFDHTR